MSINISELLLISSDEKQYQVDPQISSLDLTHGVSYGIRKKEPFLLTVRKEKDSLTATGDTEVTIAIPCDRCLEEVSVTLPVHICRHMNLKEEPDEERDDDEQGFIKGCLLDADQLVRDELVLALPSKVLCKEDCKGLCSKCGKNLNYGSCSCQQDTRDPRMAAIADLFRDFQNK